MICRRCALFLNSQTIESWTHWNKISLRLMSNKTKRKKNRQERENTIYQFVGENTNRTQRVYVWGCATTGALGNYFTNKKTDTRHQFAGRTRFDQK